MLRLSKAGSDGERTSGRHRLPQLILIDDVLLGALVLDVLLRVLDSRHVVEDETNSPLKEVLVFAIFNFKDGLPCDHIRKSPLGLRQQATWMRSVSRQHCHRLGKLTNDNGAKFVFVVKV